MSRERPILFSSAMVRAILEGRKSQTRRVVKVPASRAPEGWHADIDRWAQAPDGTWDAGQMHQGATATMLAGVRCPYGAPGDRLWVKETWSAAEPCFLGDRAQPTVFYRCNNDRPTWAERPWRPSIFMPRALSRLTLDVVAVRVERLCDITDEDARAEGFFGTAEASARGNLSIAWNAMHGTGSWDANPWVWVITFRRAESP